MKTAETDSLVLKKMRSGEFAVSIQLDPPTPESTGLADVCRRLYDVGVRIVDVNSSRRLSADSLHLSGWLARLGFEVIPHLTARDSSVNGLVNHCLAAHRYSGINNFLVITGDPYEPAHHLPLTKPAPGVFQADAIGIIKALDDYLRQRDGSTARFALAGAVNQNSRELKRERVKTKMKVAAGVDFFMSQPVFDQAGASRLARLTRQATALPLMMGIWPLTNQKTIQAINEGGIVGVKIPPAIYTEAEKFFDDEKALKFWGILRAYELATWIKKLGLAQGVYIVAPTRDPLSILELIEALIKI